MIDQLIPQINWSVIIPPMKGMKQGRFIQKPAFGNFIIQGLMQFAVPMGCEYANTKMVIEILQFYDHCSAISSGRMPPLRGR